MRVKGCNIFLLRIILPFFLTFFISCNKLPYIPDEDAIVFIKSIPSEITSQETAKIILQGEKGNGYHLPDGTVVYLSASRGNLESSIILKGGEGEATYVPEAGFSGEVEITARCGKAKISPEKLVITISDFDIKKLFIRADPAQLPYGGGRSQVEVQAVDEAMNPVSGKSIWLETDQGSLNPGGFLISDENGRTRSILTTEKAAKVSAKYKEITANVTVTIGDKNVKPVANFVYSPLQPNSGETIYFNAASSTDSDGWIASYEWDFGDGTTASGQNVTHAFKVSQTRKFSVMLLVRDNQGADDTEVKEIEITI